MNCAVLVRRVFSFLLVGACAGVLSGNAFATTISITFTGTVTTANGPDFAGVSVGNSASLTATYDTETPGFGVFAGALSDVLFSFGSYSGSVSSMDVTLVYAPFAEIANIYAVAPVGTPVGFTFLDTLSPTTLLSTYQFLPNPLLVNWLANSESHYFYVFYPESTVVATITQVSFNEVTSVPDSGMTFLLLGMGLASLGLIRRRMA